MGSKRKRSAKDVPATAPALKKQNSGSNASRAQKPKPPPTPLDSSPFVDNPRGTELKREVELYNILGSEDVSERLNAANAVVSGLLAGDGVEESTLQRHLERRLFRGLASGRKGARLGYSVVLTEIIGQLFGTKGLSREKYNGLTFEKVLGFLVAKTKPDGDLSGQEEKDHHFGMLFGLQSFVRAKILFKDESWNAILEKLLELAKKKPWIREECGWVIVEALVQMNKDQVKYTLEQLIDAGLAVSPEGVGIWLTAKTQFPDLKFPSKPWGKTGNPVENLQLLAKALKESSSNDDTVGGKPQANQTGTWNPQLHFVWTLVLAQYALGGKTSHEFEHFWKVAVDDNLFSASASRERKFWGFLLFQKVLQDSTYQNLVPSIFSHNLVRCLINHVQQPDRFLYRAADKSLKVLVEAVESNPPLLAPVIPRLTGGYGAYNFDKVTKTKTIEKLLANVDVNNAEVVIKSLLEPIQIVQGIEDPKEVDLRRQIFGDYMLHMIRKTNVTDDTLDVCWIKNTALPALVEVAYEQKDVYEPAISDSTRTLIRNRLMSAFTHLLTDLDAYIYPSDLLRRFTPDAVSMDEGITNAKDQAIATMEKLSKKAKKSSTEDKAPLQALTLLHALVIFQLYNGESEAVSILDELKLCYDKLIRHKETEDSDVEASEVLVELLLSFASRQSALLRKVTELVITAFVSDITAGGLRLMIDVLESGEGLRGQQALFDQEPEDGDDMDVDEDEEDSDVEIVDTDADEGHINGHLDKADNSEDDEESEEEDDEEMKKLDAALALALGTGKLDPDPEDESDSDADMTESEMMALDSKLVEIFSQRKKVPNKKQEQKDAKETMVNFKSRVLDLLALYIKKQASNPCAFDLLLPLLELIRTTKTKQLAEKSHNIILAFAKAFKATRNLEKETELSISAQIKIMKAIHLEASKDPSHMFAKAASTASLLVATSLYRVDPGSVKKIATVYRDSQVSWVEGEVKMQAAFFVEWVNWCQSHVGKN